MNYEAVIGLEVHVELKTKSKMFCKCSADYFGNQPNTHTCPVCLGLPGALPVPNKKAIEWCVLIGMSLSCEIPLTSKFDRKNYFYPDLAKGYQISQYDEPFAVNGWIEIDLGNKKKKIRIRRVHMEEDTGKLIHSVVGNENISLIDFNRSGVPLVEIVTEPDFVNAAEVVAYLKKLQQIIRYLNVSNADMEKGNMRLEPNISIREIGSDGLPPYKVEIKNINSFKFVEKAISYELNRQKKLLHGGKLPQQETRGWDEKKNITVSQRVKEEANDYRYFPEPDIPPIEWSQSDIDTLRKQLPESPDNKIEKFQKEFGLSHYDAEIISRDTKTADYFEETVKVGKDHNVSPKQIANLIINKKVDTENTLPTQLVERIKKSAEKSEVDEEKLTAAITELLKENQKAIEDYKSGKLGVLMFLVGLVMRKFPEKIDASIVRQTIEKLLK